MRTVRYNAFETNSSSTHTMLIPAERPEAVPKCVSFRFDSFGWGTGDANPRDYLYTAIYCYYTQEEAEEKVNTIKHALDAVGIYYDFEEPKFDSYTLSNGEVDRYLDNGSIDHSDDLGEFLDEVFSSDDTLVNFIVGGIVGTGNDNTELHNPAEDFYDSLSKEEQRKYIYCFKGN